MRTKNQIRGSKSKGSQMEFSVWDSLKPLFQNVLLTKTLGYPTQHDLEIKSHNIWIECKKHKGFSWNEIKGYWNKLDKLHEGISLVIFQANRQPVLVMFKSPLDNYLKVAEFESFFNTPFVKHVGQKKVKS